GRGGGEGGVRGGGGEIGALEPGTLEGQLDSIDGEAEWRAPVDPPLRSDPEPDDGGRAAQRMCRHASRSTAGAGGESSRPAAQAGCAGRRPAGQRREMREWRRRTSA